MYTDKSMGLYLEDKATWTNDGFGFIVGLAGHGYEPANPVFKDIVQAAYDKVLPLVALYKFETGFFISGQYPMDRKLLPPLTKDSQFQALIRSLASKTYSALVIEVMNERDDYGWVTDPGWISFAAEYFMDMVAAWLKENKPGVKLFLATSNAFIEKFAPNMNNWAFKFPSFIVQPAKISSSFPLSTEKPAHLSVRDSWEFWKYYSSTASTLVLFNGDKKKLDTFLGYSRTPVVDVPGDGEVVVPPVNEDRLKAVEAKQLALESRLAEAEAKLVAAAAKQAVTDSNLAAAESSVAVLASRLTADEKRLETVERHTHTATATVTVK